MYLLYNKSFISSRRFSFLSRVLLNRLNASSLVIFFVSIIICVILFMPQRYVLFPNSPNNSPLFCENQQSTINHQQPSLCAAAPSAHKHSRLCCVGTHEQPHRGESLFARTGPASQALSPHKSQHPLQFPKFMFNHCTHSISDDSCFLYFPQIHLCEDLQ